MASLISGIAKTNANTPAVGSGVTNEVSNGLVNTLGSSNSNGINASNQVVSQTAETTPETPATPTATMYTPTTLQNAANNASTTSTTTKTTTKSAPLTYTPQTYTPTGMYDTASLDAYNKQREAQIRQMYADAQRNTLSSLKTAYDQNLSDAEAAKAQISPQYQQSMNALGAEYERQRRNNNMQAAVNGLNTGAGSQMALAQSANYQANQAGLSQRENEAINEANRRIGDLQRNYQNAIAEATAQNNYKLAASLLDEYQNAYNRQLQIENANYERAQQIDNLNYQRQQQIEQQNYTRQFNEEERDYSRGLNEAQAKSQYGDFSGYRDLYGDDIAKAMELTWALQNPYVAYAAGKLSAEDFTTLTGQTPAGAAAESASGSGSTGASPIGAGPLTGGYRRTRSSGGGGYSASRDRAYRGPAGYLSEDGRFVVASTDTNSNPEPYAGNSPAEAAAYQQAALNSYYDAAKRAYQQ